MSKLSNCITMLQLLQTGKKFTIKELSERLEVTERMIRIYKQELEKSGIYIDSIQGPYGGYILKQNIKIPERKFSKNDIELLDRYISNEKNKDNKEKLINLKEKINGIYVGSKHEDLKYELTDNELKKYNVFNKAIKEKRKIKIIYYSYGKGDNERVINPVEMFLFENGWYSAAFCETKKDIRHFELKRVKSYELL